MTSTDRDAEAGQAKPPAPFRTTLLRVLLVQAVALTLLGLLQLVYNVG